MTTVFDIAAEFIERSGGFIETVKLQKLCFYSFGWYAHLTAEPLFSETFYAMQKGPVVGELLSAHAKQESIDLEVIEGQRKVREDLPEELDPYKQAVLDAVWAAYGKSTSWQLVDKTHEEAVWDVAWASRRPGTRRGELASEDVIEYFLDRLPADDECLELPPPMISRATATELEEIETQARVHQPYIEAVRAFQFAS